MLTRKFEGLKFTLLVKIYNYMQVHFLGKQLLRRLNSDSPSFCFRNGNNYKMSSISNSAQASILSCKSECGGK